MDYVALDLEMTGLNVKKDKIIEIGAVRMRGGHAAAQFSALINPHCRLDPRITELTQITDAELADGEELADALAAFLDFCGEDVILGHNLNFDYSFLLQACLNLGFSFHPQGIDTLKLARQLLPATQKKTLVALRTFFAIETAHVHRAYDDAYAAAMVYEKLYAQYASAKPDLFLPAPFQIRIKKQQPVTIPQKEQLNRLLSLSPSPKKGTPLYSILSASDFSVETLTRSEASRLIEQLLQNMSGDGISGSR